MVCDLRHVWLLQQLFNWLSAGHLMQLRLLPSRELPPGQIGSFGAQEVPPTRRRQFESRQ